MQRLNLRYLHFILIILSASAVFVIAHQDSFKNQYMINDDCRQQTYWMQKWQEPDLYKNDFISEYARNYVPWGIQGLNFIASKFIDPLQFSKILTAILFIVTAAFIFGIGLQFQDTLVAYFAVCFYFLMGTFLTKIAGGLSQSFVFPILVIYIYLLLKNSLWGTSITIFFASILNPYVFVLCLMTHINISGLIITGELLYSLAGNY